LEKYSKLPAKYMYQAQNGKKKCYENPHMPNGNRFPGSATGKPISIGQNYALGLVN
jgi:hypothetical protein